MILSGCACVLLCIMWSIRDMSVSFSCWKQYTLCWEHVPKPTWCWEHVSKAYLMLRTCAHSLLDRAWVVPSGCGVLALICSESTLSFQGVSGGRYSRAFTRSPSIPTCIIKVWKKANSIIFVLFIFIWSLSFLLKLGQSTSGAIHDLSGCELRYPFRSTIKIALGYLCMMRMWA